MKKEYKTPIMKVREISPVILLSTSDEQSLRMIDDDDLQNLDEEYSQW